MSALVHHDASRIVDDDFSFLLYAASTHFNDAPLRLRFGFAFFQNLRFRVQRVACEQRIRQFDFIPSERESVFADIRHAHACNNREREGAVDQTFSELGAFTVFVIEMDLVGIVRQEGEPNIVVFRYGSSEAAAVYIPDLEVFEISGLPNPGLTGMLNPPQLVYNWRPLLYTLVPSEDKAWTHPYKKRGNRFVRRCAGSARIFRIRIGKTLISTKSIHRNLSMRSRAAVISLL